MRTLTFTILLLLSNLVDRTAAADALSTTITQIANTNPVSIFAMGDQPFSEANFQRLARAVGSVFTVFQTMTLPYISTSFSSHEGSLQTLSSLISVLNATINRVNQTLTSEIDYHEAQDTLEFQRLNSQIALLNTKVVGLEIDLKSNVSLLTANFNWLNRTLSQVNATYSSITTNLQTQINAVNLRINKAIEMLNKKIDDEQIPEERLFGYYNSTLKYLNSEVENITTYLVDEEVAEDVLFDKISLNFSLVDSNITAINKTAQNISEYLVKEQTWENETFAKISLNFSLVDSNITEINKTADNISSYLVKEQTWENETFDKIDAAILALQSQTSTSSQDPSKVVFTTNQTLEYYKVASFDFNGFASTASVTNTFNSFSVTSDPAADNSKLHVYTVTIPTNTFKFTPVISVSLKSLLSLSSSNPDTLVTYTNSITSNTFKIFVSTPGNNLASTSYNVQVILYGK